MLHQCISICCYKLKVPLTTNETTTKKLPFFTDYQGGYLLSVVFCDKY